MQWIDESERCHFWRYGPSGVAPRRCLAAEGHTDSGARDAHEWAECPHEPNALGTQCQHCGIPAEMVTPDELADAMLAALTARNLTLAGQVGLFDE